MNTIQQLFNSTKYEIPVCHQQLALQIDEQLNEGISFKKLGGKKIRRCSDLIRFKIGRDFRLVYSLKQAKPIPMFIVSRQHFDKKLNRR
jgi:hypothetical protein